MSQDYSQHQPRYAAPSQHHQYPTSSHNDAAGSVAPPAAPYTTGVPYRSQHANHAGNGYDHHQNSHYPNTASTAAPHSHHNTVAASASSSGGSASGFSHHNTHSNSNGNGIHSHHQQHDHTVHVASTPQPSGYYSEDPSSPLLTAHTPFVDPATSSTTTLSSRLIPSFDIRNRGTTTNGNGKGEEYQPMLGTPLEKANGKSVGSGAGRTMRQRVMQIMQGVKSLSPVQIIKYLVVLIILILVARFAYHAYSDRLKANHYTIVSLVRNVHPQTSEDPSSYAFQHTALTSWSQLLVGKNILIYVDDPNTECARIESIIRGVQCLPVPCHHKEHGKPLMSCLFSSVHAQAPTETVVYVNSDVVLFSDLSDAIRKVQTQQASLTSQQQLLADGKQADKYVLVGRRTNTLVSPILLEDYESSTYPARLRQHAERTGSLHSAYSIDMIAYSKKVMKELTSGNEPVTTTGNKTSSNTNTISFPPFLGGVGRWDNWFLSQAILDESVTVIDITPSVMFLHQEYAGGGSGAGGNGVQVLTANGGASKIASTNSASSGSSLYNDNLAKALSGTKYKIGTIDNAGYLLQPHSAELVKNTNITDVVLFTKKASEQGYLVILTVNHNYINLALNWVCWAERIRFTNFILIAEDQSSATYFQKRGVAVIVKKDAPWIKNAGDYGSVEFQETMTFRTEFLMNVLTAGFHFVTADMDGLWLDDPLISFNHHADLQGQMHKVTKISGGLVIVRASTYGRYFWNMVIECQRGNAQFLATAKPGTYVAATYTEQYCINELSRGLASQPLFSRSLLDPYVFPDGKSFFDEKQSQYRGIWPAIIHNNWIVGTGNKIKRLHDWKLASATQDTQECIALEHTFEFPKLPWIKVEPTPQVKYDLEHPRILGAPVPPAENPDTKPAWSDMTGAVPFPFDLRIRVLTSSDPTALKSCLKSLSQTVFEGMDKHRISLDISIDHPPAGASDDVMKGWQDVTQLAKEFVWNTQSQQHKPTSPGLGEKTIFQQPFHLGQSGQYLRGWLPHLHTDQELMLFISDQAVLSTQWFTWLKRAVMKYYSHPAQYDPRLFGISLSPQPRVYGETYMSRYSEDPALSKQPSDYLYGKGIGVFKYQLWSEENLATVVFPQHWRAFLTWTEKQGVDALSGLTTKPATLQANNQTSAPTACVPTMITNKWWQEKPAVYWYQWLNRFNFEQGYYWLYQNWEGKEALAVSATSLQQQTNMIGRPLPKLATHLTTQHQLLPSSPLIPVFDYQFNRVSTPDILSWRSAIVAQLDQCWTMDRLAKKIADDEAYEAAIQKAKEEAKAKAAEEKKAKLAAEKAKAKAEKDAANKAKKEAEDKAKAEKAAADKKKKDADAAAKKKADGDKKPDSKDKKKDDKKKDDKKKDDKKQDDKKKDDKKKDDKKKDVKKEKKKEEKKKEE